MGHNPKKGAAVLLTTFIVAIVLTALAGTVAFILTHETREVSFREKENKALYLAEAGLNQATVIIQSSLEALYASSKSVSQSLTYLDGLSGTTIIPQTSLGGGSFLVNVVSISNVVGTDRRRITLNATGTYNGVSATISAIKIFGFSASRVFDHSYFINNFGWFYGGTQNLQGDIRANGRMEVRGAQKVNGDVYSSMDVDESQGEFFYDSISRYYSTASTRARPGDPPDVGGVSYPGGYDGFADNYDPFSDPRNPADPQLHPNQQPVEMPYLGDLSYYQALAASKDGTISQGGTVLVDNVYNGSMVLVGTAQNPIVIDGPVVITNDVVIKGVVSGQGTIYAGRNTHIIGSVTYADPPSWPKPDSDPLTTSAQNVNKDFLGLCAKGNVIFGDYLSSKWQNQVKQYIRPPFTNPYSVDQTDASIGYASYYQGGTPYFSGDYTAVDGGKKSDNSDRRYYESSLANNAFSNLSPTNDITQIDALVYTNHAIAGQVKNIKFNGSIIGRDEGIIFSGSLTMNFDYRVKEKGREFVDIQLPISIMKPETERWQKL